MFYYILVPFKTIAGYIFNFYRLGTANEASGQTVTLAQPEPSRSKNIAFSKQATLFHSTES
jgi:hypothetical protein